VGPDRVDDQLDAAGALGDPLRRALYDHVASQTGAVSREHAAAAAGISRSLAGFHLDRLVHAGLLQSSFRRLNSRRGPGAGRPAKVYRRSSRQIAISLPPRRYDLAAELFARSMESMGQASALRSLGPAARAYGRSIARKETQEPGVAKPPRQRLRAVLDACGFETQTDRDRLWLRNCPFDLLAQAHRSLVCGAALELVRGVLQGLGLRGASARIEPRPGRCCVTVSGLKPVEAGNVVVEASGRPA
jgi:predicted ArsR family transcriptional regulator